MRTTLCKSCQAQIMWGITINDKRIPLDYPPEKRFVVKGVDDQGNPLVATVETYVSHFATCPQAAEHRHG